MIFLGRGYRPIGLVGRVEIRRHEAIKIMEPNSALEQLLWDGRETF